MNVSHHRTRRFPWLAVGALIVGLMAGTLFGYQLRGESNDSPTQEIERRVPTVTVTSP